MKIQGPSDSTTYYLSRQVMILANCFEAFGMMNILSISYIDKWVILNASLVSWRKWKICGICKYVLNLDLLINAYNIIGKMWNGNTTSHIDSISSLSFWETMCSFSQSRSAASSFTEFLFRLCFDIVSSTIKNKSLKKTACHVT